MRKASWLSSNQALGILFFLLSGWIAIAPKLHHNKARQDIRLPAASLSIALLVIAIARPHWLAPLNRAWIKLGETLGRIVTPVVLGALFFGVVTPAAFLFRRFADSYKNWKIDPSLKSYWIDRSASSSSSTEKNAFKYQF